MILIVTSNEDEASVNIREQLLAMADWEEHGEFEGNPVYLLNDDLMVSINRLHLWHDNIDKEIESLTGKTIESVIYASRHRSESQRRTLTLHPIGNFSKAEFGGRDKTLVNSSPHLMCTALRVLSNEARNLDYTVSLEVTHHGPYLEKPTFFIEIGSTEKEWNDEKAGKVIARTILKSIDQCQRFPTAIGVGGGHYAPRFTEVVLSSEISIGHMISNYALDVIDRFLLEEAVKKSGAEYVYFHRKAIKKSKYNELKEFFEELGIKPVRTRDLKAIYCSAI